MIDLTKAKAVLDDAEIIIEQVDQKNVDDFDSIGGTDNRKEREYKAQMNRNLLLLADRLELASQLVRAEYWFAKGEPDALEPGRDK